jgi:hypothetical protein
MESLHLTPDQQFLVNMPLTEKVFLEGPAGTGKTTAAVHRLEKLLEEGVDSSSILILLPQRTLANLYLQTLSKQSNPDGGIPSILTLAGLAQRMVDLFWPLVANEAGFIDPDKSPTFLTLETAQYYMARVVRPLFSQGFFESVTINRNRLYSQILDNLNKSAVVGFPYTMIGVRLKDAWRGDPSQERVYDDAQECAVLFRHYCLEHNLLDFSLQVEVFIKHLWQNQLCKQYLYNRYQHLIFDNLEEDTPVSHDLIREWLPNFDSALLIIDQGGGYRRFLGADPTSAKMLRDLCDQRMVFSDPLVTSHALEIVADHFGQILNHQKVFLGSQAGEHVEDKDETIKPALFIQSRRYHPQMLDWIADQIAELIFQEHIPPGEIAVLAPYLSDALRFSLLDRFERRKIPATSHRPSRALSEETATQCLITLATLAHPEWGILPSKFDIAYGLVKAIDGMDLVRAQLLAQIVYRVYQGKPVLTPFDRIKTETQERITFTFGLRYERLRSWIEDYQQQPMEELDYFFSRLFGEVLSQPGFGFHHDHQAGGVAANLIESARKFRQVLAGEVIGNGKTVSQEYVEMVQEGVVAAQYISSWQIKLDEAVFLAPAYTFLLSNQPVDVQIWLDIGSMGWSERLYQPLTQPYVLSRHWPEGSAWTDADEVHAGEQALSLLVCGLIRRCRNKLFLVACDLGEQGYEQKGHLLRAVQKVSNHLSTIIKTF